MAGKPDIKLVYFDGRGRAEPIRMTMIFGGVRFEDVRVTGPEWWSTVKAESPYGKMPYIEYRGKQYGESKAIASFVAKLADLGGKSPEESLRVDEVYSLIGDFIEETAAAHLEKDPVKKAKKEAEVVAEAHTYLGFYENMLASSTTGLFLPSGMSLADLTVYDVTHTVMKLHADVLKAYPNIQKMRSTLETLPKVKAYLNERQDSDV